MKIQTIVKTGLLATTMFAASAYAGLITPSSVTFNDLGKTTIDTETGLEWLDVTETYNKSMIQVLNELQDPTSTYRAIDGWRYATRFDLINLIDSWFGFDLKTGDNFYKSLYLTYTTENPKMDLFVSTFGDLATLYGDGSYVSGSIHGWVSESGYWEGHSTAGIYDRDYMNINGEIVYRSDVISIGQLGLNPTSSISAASFLVRCSLPGGVDCLTKSYDFPIGNVSEPSAPVLFIAGLIALVVVRKHFQTKAPR